jgi:hypothetical protein
VLIFILIFILFVFLILFFSNPHWKISIFLEVALLHFIDMLNNPIDITMNFDHFLMMATTLLRGPAGDKLAYKFVNFSDLSIGACWLKQTNILSNKFAVLDVFLQRPIRRIKFLIWAVSFFYPGSPAGILVLVIRIILQLYQKILGVHFMM